MGPDPINSNQNSKTCGEVTSSNCVAWAGGQVPGLNLCKGASITDVIVSMATNCCGGGTKSPCATGNWVDFSSTIPASGSNGATTWTISNFGIGGEEKPMYKWTDDGNLMIRGTFEFKISPAVMGQAFCIPLGTVSSSCLAAGYKTQTTQVNVSAFGDQLLYAFFTANLVLDASGVIKLCITFQSAKLDPGDFTITLGATTFNIK